LKLLLPILTREGGEIAAFQSPNEMRSGSMKEPEGVVGSYGPCRVQLKGQGGNAGNGKAGQAQAKVGPEPTRGITGKTHQEGYGSFDVIELFIRKEVVLGVRKEAFEGEPKTLLFEDQAALKAKGRCRLHLFLRVIRKASRPEAQPPKPWLTFLGSKACG
jgi:hypothetical protein